MCLPISILHISGEDVKIHVPILFTEHWCFPPNLFTARGWCFNTVYSSKHKQWAGRTFGVAIKRLQNQGVYLYVLLSVEWEITVKYDNKHLLGRQSRHHVVPPQFVWMWSQYQDYPTWVPLDSVNVETAWVCFTEECWRVSSRGWPASCWQAPPDLCRSSCECSTARWCHPQNLKQTFGRSQRGVCNALCLIQSYYKEVRKFTSDSSWEGVGELLHVFGLCLRLVFLSSEDNLDSTLKRKQIVHTVKSKAGKREREK